MPASLLAMIRGRGTWRRFAACLPLLFLGPNCPNGLPRCIRRPNGSREKPAPINPARIIAVSPGRFASRISRRRKSSRGSNNLSENTSEPKQAWPPDSATPQSLDASQLFRQFFRQAPGFFVQARADVKGFRLQNHLAILVQNTMAKINSDFINEHRPDFNGQQVIVAGWVLVAQMGFDDGEDCVMVLPVQDRRSQGAQVFPAGRFQQV